eukprot:CAMPEP_0113875344 /NCGR_PEP_ID=MMETSP0780_2-20120614/4898_1 /TAXON_ID=652834 /ORGANISM="Palpitomonas bilix" /LENGTH=389 /DNA_ID=CAMNT_0000861339 /DNA_START=29 /DNA_END=1198 /DNA_ORIENTATION=- /assembly_acc=CAM_ASM_000599
MESAPALLGGGEKAYGKRHKTSPYAEPLPFGRKTDNVPSGAGYGTRKRAQVAALKREEAGPSGYKRPTCYKGGALAGLPLLRWKVPVRGEVVMKPTIPSKQRQIHPLTLFYQSYTSPYATEISQDEHVYKISSERSKANAIGMSMRDSLPAVWSTSSSISPLRERRTTGRSDQDAKISVKSDRREVVPLSPWKKGLEDVKVKNKDKYWKAPKIALFSLTIFCRDAYVDHAPSYTPLVSSHEPGSSPPRQTNSPRIRTLKSAASSSVHQKHKFSAADFGFDEDASSDRNITTANSQRPNSEHTMPNKKSTAMQKAEAQRQAEQHADRHPTSTAMLPYRAGSGQPLPDSTTSATLQGTGVKVQKGNQVGALAGSPPRAIEGWDVLMSSPRM